MAFKSKIVALLLLVFGAIETTSAQESPGNDSCESATEVTSFPFTDSGSLANATQETFNSTWTGELDGQSDAWYIFPDLAEGSELRVSIGSFNSEVYGQILVSNDELGSCPNAFLSPESVTMSSSIDSEKNTGLSISTTTEKDSVYYLVLYPTGGGTTAEPDFDLEVDIVAAGDITTTTTTPTLTDAELEEGARANDSCESATEVTSFPFTDSGSLANATQETFNSTWTGELDGQSDAWYIFPDLAEGSELRVSIGSFNSEVYGQILVSNDELGSCPDAFLSPESVTMSSSIDSEKNTGLSISTTTKKDLVYYLVMYPTGGGTTAEPDFELEVDIVAAGDITTASTTTPTLTDAELEEGARANDSCESATEVTSFPFTDSGSLANATKDTFDNSWTGELDGQSDAWYIFPDLAEGSELRVLIASFNSEVFAQILVSNDELGICPDAFLSPESMSTSSTIDSEKNTAFSIYVTPEKDSVYYLVLYPTGGGTTTEPGFNLTVDFFPSDVSGAAPPAPESPTASLTKSNDSKTVVSCGSTLLALASMIGLLSILFV